jgi:hypothetical protein
VSGRLSRVTLSSMALSLFSGAPVPGTALI